MKVSALEEYGLRCLLQLAKTDGGPLTLPEISEREGLSLSYVGKLMMILKKAGLVQVVRGRQGGYMLTDKPDKIFLKAVFEALGGPLYDSGHCDRYTGDQDNCVHLEDCTVRRMWRGFSDMISAFLGKLTLADLAEGDYDFKKQMEKILSEHKPN